MSKLYAMAFPILPGKEEQWKKFTAELNSKRRDEYRKSRKELKVHERTFLQHTPQGDLVIVTLEGEDPMSAFAAFANSDSDFSSWFFQQVIDIHGFDLRKPPPGPMPELIIDSQG